MGSFCYKGVPGATEDAIAESCKIALPCHEIGKLAPELLTKPSEDGCVYVVLRGLVFRSF